jgi:hypothetical protein
MLRPKLLAKIIGNDHEKQSWYYFLCINCSIFRHNLPMFWANFGEKRNKMVTFEAYFRAEKSCSLSAENASGRKKPLLSTMDTSFVPSTYVRQMHPNTAKVPHSQ